MKKAIKLLVESELRVAKRKRTRIQEDMELLDNGMTKGEVSLLLMQASKMNEAETLDELAQCVAELEDVKQSSIQLTPEQLKEEFLSRLCIAFPELVDLGARETFDDHFAPSIWSQLTNKKLKSLLWTPTRKFITFWKLKKPRYTKTLKLILEELGDMLP
jgi:hypothetical protein